MDIVPKSLLSQLTTFKIVDTSQTWTVPFPDAFLEQVSAVQLLMSRLQNVKHLSLLGRTCGVETISSASSSEEVSVEEVSVEVVQ
jgi:hypothetical protein